MAATRSAKNPTKGNDTPNTPEVSESAIARMKVDELRRKLQGRGVKGTAELKKPELVKKLIKLETAGAKAKKSASGRKNPTSGNDTPNTPDVSESAIARMKVGELRRELESRGVKGTAELKKPELVKKLIKLETAGTKAKKSGSVSTTKKGRSTSKKVSSAAVKLPTTKKLLFAQTDLPSSEKVSTSLEVGENQAGGSRHKANSRKRTGKATAVIR